MTQSTDQGTIWLTQEAFDKLAAELENLKGPVRQEIIARISAARDEGDLNEERRPRPRWRPQRVPSPRRPSPGSAPRAPRGTSRRTAATTPPRTSRARSRGGSA